MRFFKVGFKATEGVHFPKMKENGALNKRWRENVLFPQQLQVQFSSGQLLSSVWLFATPWTAACQAFQSFTISWSLLKLMSIESVMPSTHLVLCYPFLLLPSVFLPSGSFLMSQVFASGGQNIGASASASVLPMNIQDWSPIRLTGLISLLSKGLKSLLQRHNSKASILWRSAFFMVQVSHLYVTTGKTIALTTQTLSAKRCLC